MQAAQDDWRRDAACTSHDPELFFPVGSAGPALAQLKQAQQICLDCPVRVPCLEWAIKVGAEDGVWGGFSEQERQSLRRRRRSGRSVPLKPSTLEAALTLQAASRIRTANAADSLGRHPEHRPK
jgi:WhiB family redox-sensing transcriptional regulator